MGICRLQNQRLTSFAREELTLLHRAETVNLLRADIQELGACLVPIMEEQTRILRVILEVLQQQQETHPTPTLVVANKRAQIVYGPNDLPTDLLGEKE
jgi:hypothetical protein